MKFLGNHRVDLRDLGRWRKLSRLAVESGEASTPSLSRSSTSPPSLLDGSGLAALLENRWLQRQQDSGFTLFFFWVTHTHKE
ncbi:hypothetical protein PIB30_057206 [Stylosanthes scabra]|uniref:Uncharacterized protein n=1 Tax=Stylosanthes scabra TaxID=79078 RepID=A0ABU6WMY2_9FABA|nr:hypothetical protein [Stylosanthes scabra]